MKCVVYPVFKVKSSHFLLIVSHRQILKWSWIDTYLKEIYFKKIECCEHFDYEYDRSFFWDFNLKCVVYSVLNGKSSHFLSFFFIGKCIYGVQLILI